jgi:hypothetical protein
MREEQNRSEQRSKLVELLFEKERDEIVAQWKKKRRLFVIKHRTALNVSTTYSALLEIDLEKAQKLVNARMRIENENWQGSMTKEYLKGLRHRVTRTVMDQSNEIRGRLPKEITARMQSSAVVTFIMGAAQTGIAEISAKAQREIVILSLRTDLGETPRTRKERSADDGIGTGSTWKRFLRDEFNLTVRGMHRRVNQLVADKGLSKLLNRDIETAVRCLFNDLEKPCLIMCGGIIEGILYERLASKPKTQRDIAYRKVRTGTTTLKQFSNYTLSDFIDVGVELEVIEKTTGKMGHGVRDYRNYIHPQKEAKQKHPISMRDARMACDFVFKLLEEL